MDGRAEDSGIRAVPIALGGALTLATCMGIGRFIYTPILPVMMVDLHQTAGDVGAIAAANYLGYLLGAVALALPGIPGSRRAWLLGGLSASIATTALAGVVSSFPALILIRLVSGIASAVGFVYASSLVLERINAAGRPGLASLLFSGIGTGIVVSALAVAIVERAGFGWRTMWWVGAALSVLATAVIAVLVPPAAESNRAAPNAAATTAPARRRTDGGSPAALARMVAAYGLLGFGYIIGATFMVAIVRADPTTRTLDHWVWPAVGLAAAPAPAIWSIVARRLNPYRTYALGSLLQASGIVVSVLWISAGSALYAAVTLGATFTALTAIGIVGARNLTEADPRQVVAGMTAAFGIGQIVGPLLAGYAVDRTGSFAIPSMIAAAALLLGAALTVTIRDPRAGRRA